MTLPPRAMLLTPTNGADAFEIGGDTDCREAPDGSVGGTDFQIGDTLPPPAKPIAFSFSWRDALASDLKSFIWIFLFITGLAGHLH
jgi:hypothetical protein